jgi:neurobeachin-like protein 1/2
LTLFVRHVIRSRNIIAAPFSPVIDIKSCLFVVSHDAKFIISGAHWDWSLRVYSLLKSKMITSIIHHTDIITCVALDSTGLVLVTGSRDTTCVIWHLSFDDYRTMNTSTEQDSSSLLLPTVTLYGHTAEVTCLAVSMELDLTVSGSLDGTCNIHTVQHGVYLRTLNPIGDPIVNLKLSDERHILIQCERDETHLFLYTINGDHIRTKKLEYNVTDLLVSNEHIILAVNHFPTTSSSSSMSKESHGHAAARIIIKDMFEYVLRLYSSLCHCQQFDCRSKNEHHPDDSPSNTNQLSIFYERFQSFTCRRQRR